jgi:acetyl esterase/lipase
MRHTCWYTFLFVAAAFLEIDGVSCFTFTGRLHRYTTLPLRSHKNAEVAEDVSRATPRSDNDQMVKPRTTLHREDDGFRKLRKTWPLWFQHWLRDSGMLRAVINTLTRISAAPLFFQENPHCLWEFIRISGYSKWAKVGAKTAGLVSFTKPTVDFSIESYGPHSCQYAQVMANRVTTRNDGSVPLMIFVHGGAWGSGFPTMYRLVAAPFLARNYRVAVLGYRTYPDATVQGQVDDVMKGINYFASKSRDPIVVIGHSSGAHIVLMAALQSGLSSRVAGIIAMSGVYDIPQHYEYECSRGVDQISPMAPACGGTLENWKLASPTYLIPSVDNSILNSMAPTLFLHGTADTTVPSKSSQEVYAAIVATRCCVSCQLQLLDAVGHSDTILETMLGGKTQDTVFAFLDALLMGKGNVGTTDP